jgi:polysaccharide export outer membrane protein
VTEARVAIQEHLKQFLDSPEVAVEVIAYQSKVYYVITQGAEMGDNVHRFLVTGNETVLDAIAQVNGLSQLSSTKIWVARPAPAGFGCQQILPVDWQAISAGGETATNYQLMPGDRIYIAADKMLTASNFLGKVISPVERIAGSLGLVNSTIRGYETMGRGYNQHRNGY